MVFGASASHAHAIRRIEAAIKGGPVRDRRGTRFTLEGRGAADTFAVPIEARLHPKTIWFLGERGAPTCERLDFFILTLPACALRVMGVHGCESIIDGYGARRVRLHGVEGRRHLALQPAIQGMMVLWFRHGLWRSGGNECARPVPGA